MQKQIWMCCAVLALLSAGPAPTGQQAPVDLVVVNAKVLTVDPKNTQAEAVAIRGNTFAAVGTTAAIRKMAGPGTRVIDAGGRTVVPGFIESHVHATGVARGEVSQVFVQLNSIQEIRDWVRARAKDAGSGTGSCVIFRIIVDIGPSSTPHVAPSSAHCCQYCEAEKRDLR